MGKVIVTRSKGKVDFFEFPTDQSQVAPVIYEDLPHRTTNMGVIISKEITRELRRFLRSFTKFIREDWPVVYGPYCRIDAYFDKNSITILEVNTNFVDGWGTALNLSRTSGISINPRICRFPSRFVLNDESYLPELKLFIKELSNLNDSNDNISYISVVPDLQDEIYREIKFGSPAYYYCRSPYSTYAWLIPYKGAQLDCKSHLAIKAEYWKSKLVKIPKHYTSNIGKDRGKECSWENLPDNVVLKFDDKINPAAQKSWFNVFMGKPSGKGSSLKRLYNDGIVLAQEMITPTKFNGNNCQLIILAIGANIVGGYVQYSPKAIITDDSLHGPLWIQQ